MRKGIILAAGGTGGHIIPAISLGQWIMENHPEYSLKYVCGTRSLETEIYERHRIEPFVLPIEGSPLGKRNPACFLKRSAGMLKSFYRVRRLMNTEAPEMCILFGGYISLPVLLAAHLNEIPILIHEQNARAGKLTRLAFRMGKKILSGWDECSPLDANCFRSVGIPVRKINRLQVFEAWNILHIGSEPPEGPIVVVMGGSLGSRNVFDLVCSAASKDEMKYITFLLVGGKGIVSDSVPKNVVPIAKCWDLEPLISLADAIITRAGASTLSEISVYGLPAVVIPWESAAEGHQVLNAESFIKRNAGCLWQEKDAIDVLIKNIKDMVESRKILSDAEKETRRILINENIWKEMLFTRGREIL